MKWLLILALLFPFQASAELNLEWRDGQTIRIAWSSPAQAGCLFVDGRAVDVPCSTFRTVLLGPGAVDVFVAAGMLVEVRNAGVVLASAVLPPNPYPQRLTVTPSGGAYLIVWDTGGPDGCVAVRDPVFDTILAPCAPSGSITTTLAPGSRVVLLVNGVEVGRVILAPALAYLVYLPLVIR